MDRDTMRKQMEGIRDELNRLDEERTALDALIRDYEAWFRARPENGAKPQRQPAQGVSGRGGKPKGSVSFRKGEIMVLQQARGEPLVDEEIWRRMQDVGVKSDSKNPLGFVNLTAKGLDDVERVSPKTWRWVGSCDSVQ